MDNVLVERLWHTVKCEGVYLGAYETLQALQRELAKYFRYDNTQRRHTALDRRTPDAVFLGGNDIPQAA